MCVCVRTCMCVCVFACGGGGTQFYQEIARVQQCVVLLFSFSFLLLQVDKITLLFCVCFLCMRILKASVTTAPSLDGYGFCGYLQDVVWWLYLRVECKNDFWPFGFLSPNAKRHIFPSENHNLVVIFPLYPRVLSAVIN